MIQLKINITDIQIFKEGVYCIFPGSILKEVNFWTTLQNHLLTVITLENALPAAHSPLPRQALRNIPC